MYTTKGYKNYYKYYSTDVTIPTLTGNGTLGGTSFAVESTNTYNANLAAWKMFDGDNTTYCNMVYVAIPYFIIYNPIPIKFTSATIRWSISSASGTSTSTVNVYGSNDKITWHDITKGVTSTSTSINTPVEYTIDTSLNKHFYKYYKFENTTPYSTSYVWLVYAVTLNSPKVLENPTPGTNDVQIPMVWGRPVLNANGTLGGTVFAVQASSELNTNCQAWRAVDGTESTSANYYWNATSLPAWFTFYNPNAINVTKLTIANMPTSANYIITAGEVQGSDDNSSWTTIKSFTNSVITANSKWSIDLSDNTSYYKYYRLYITSTYVSGGTTGYTVINELYIEATEKITVLKSTSSDYDFHTETSDTLIKTENIPIADYSEDYTIPLGLTNNSNSYCTCSSTLGTAYLITSSSNQLWYSGTGAGGSCTWTFDLAANNHIPAGANCTLTFKSYKYYTQISSSSYGRGGWGYPTVTFYYTDNTSEEIYNYDGFIGYTSSITELTTTVTATKEVNKITLSGSSPSAGSGQDACRLYAYGFSVLASSSELVYKDVIRYYAVYN